MPAPAAAAAIAGGAALTGGLANIASTFIQNRKSRQFSREMYDRQYRDNINFWRMQNEYNTPASQMARLKQAGLNPNLIYGQGARGATGQAEKISTPDVKSAQFNTPDMSFVGQAGMSFLNAMYDFEIKKAQTDNMRAQNTVLLADAAMKMASTQRSRFDLGFESDLRDISAETRKEMLRQLKSNTDISLRKDEREAAMNSSNLKEAAQRILRMREDIARSAQERKRIKEATKNLKTDRTLKQLDIDLWKKGISRTDPLWMRVLARHIEDLLNPSFNLFKN